MTQQLCDLIHRYLRAVENTFDLFERATGERNPLNVRQRPGQDGDLGPSASYSFHGIGCSVRLDGIEVDYDFLDRDAGVGFDSWRLMLFAEQFPDMRDVYPNQTTIENDLNELVRQGLVVLIDTHSGTMTLPNGPLYPLAKQSEVVG